MTNEEMQNVIEDYRMYAVTERGIKNLSSYPYDNSDIGYEYIVEDFGISFLFQQNIKMEVTYEHPYIVYCNFENNLKGFKSLTYEQAFKMVIKDRDFIEWIKASDEASSESKRLVENGGVN